MKRRGKAPGVTNPAPGELQLLLAFTNTVDFGSGTQELASQQAMSGWLAKRRLLPREKRLDRAELERVKAACSGLRALIASNSGVDLSPDAAERLDALAAIATVRVRFDTDGSTFFEPASEDLDGAFGRLFALVAEARSEGLWPRLKICGESSCQRIFFDASRNRRGRWCSTHCGNQHAARVYRRRETRASRPPVVTKVTTFVLPPRTRGRIKWPEPPALVLGPPTGAKRLRVAVASVESPSSRWALPTPQALDSNNQALDFGHGEYEYTSTQTYVCADVRLRRRINEGLNVVTYPGRKRATGASAGARHLH
jgi:hypothetical protein